MLLMALHHLTNWKSDIYIVQTTLKHSVCAYKIKYGILISENHICAHLKSEHQNPAIQKFSLLNGI